jgi:dTDP-4-amino-4,6-dideoxygalactose transaminase
MQPPDERIPFSVPWLSGREDVYLREVFENRIFGGHGPFTKRCMALLEAMHDAKRALLTTSCTAALEMAAMLSNVGPGDEVIVPSYTFVATASAFLRTGATLVFAEVDPATMTLDLADVERRITPATRAIVPIHYGGIAADVAALSALADAHGLLLVEDAAQGLDAWLDGRRLGTFAPLSAFSFHETKNIHAGLAGALLLHDDELVERAEFIWHRGTDRTRMLRGMTDKYTWVELGSSFYPAEIQAAFLLAQLESLAENTRLRGVAWRTYETALRPLADAGHFHAPTIDDRRQTNHHA